MSACPACASETLPGANFCGRCGARLGPPASPEGAACRCGAGPDSIDAAGFCLECGVHQTRIDPRDHQEVSQGADLGGVTDRGRRHAANEDAIGIAEVAGPSGAVRMAVICDGVSTSTQAARASAVAVEAFLAAATADLIAGGDLEGAARRGADAAQAAVLAIPFAKGDPPPAATLVAALANSRRAVVAWAGDSRAYRLEATASTQLTRDDSWCNEQIDRGELTAEQARAHPYAHAIVNSLGGLADSDAFVTHLADVVLSPGARLLLCSDGLWNHAQTTDELTALVPAAGAAVDICRELVAFANRAGGHDNISAVLLRPPPGTGVQAR